MDESMDDDISQPKAMGLPRPKFLEKNSLQAALVIVMKRTMLQLMAFLILFGSLLLL